MKIRIYDSHNKQWLEPISIVFSDSKISRITACIAGDSPLNDGFYTIEKEELDLIAVTGCFSHNEHLIPKDQTDTTIINLP